MLEEQWRCCPLDPQVPVIGRGARAQPVLLPCSKVLSLPRHHGQNQRNRPAGQNRLQLRQDSLPAVPDPAAGRAEAHDQGAREGHRGRTGSGPPQGAIPHTQTHLLRGDTGLLARSPRCPRTECAGGGGQGWDRNRNSHYLPVAHLLCP